MTDAGGRNSDGVSDGLRQVREEVRLYPVTARDFTRARWHLELGPTFVDGHGEWACNVARFLT